MSANINSNKDCQRLYYRFNAASQQSDNLHKNRKATTEEVSRLGAERNSYWSLPFRDIRSNLQQEIVSKKKLLADLDRDCQQAYQANKETYDQLQECLANPSNHLETHTINLSFFGKGK